MNQLPLSTRGLFFLSPFAMKIIKINLWNQGSISADYLLFWRNASESAHVKCDV
jgi:hypothetical protein